MNYIDKIKTALDTEFMNTAFLGNHIKDYLIALIIALIMFVFFKFFKTIAIKYLRKLVSKTKNLLDDTILDSFLKHIYPIAYYFIFYVASRSLKLNPQVEKIITYFGVIFVTYCVTKFIYEIAVYIIDNGLSKKKVTSTTNRGIKTILRLILWSLSVVFVLDNLGFDISAIIAGLGIGGVAIALASQNILNDLFNYFVIFFDRPFEEGDYIVVDDFMGTIKHIGIKTTRMESLSGEEVVFSNSDLTKNRIRNFRKMQKRRIAFTIGVEYDTPVDKMKKIPSYIKEIIESVDGVEFARAHFKKFNDFSLDFEIVYFVKKSDYDFYMDVQEKINLALKEKFETEKIEFAYPTQTVLLRK